MTKGKEVTGGGEIEAEVARLLEVLDISVNSKEERLTKEAKIGEVFPEITNSQLISLYKTLKHGKIRFIAGEFERRIKEGDQFILVDLVGLADHFNFGGVSFGAKSAMKKFYDLITQGIGNRSPNAPADEVEDVIIRYAHTQLDNNTTILGEVLSWRDDSDQITREVMRTTSTGGQWSRLDKHFVEELKVRSIEIRKLRSEKRG